jgi:alpha/beta superfamily hydrolase
MATFDEERITFGVESVACEGVLAYPVENAPRAAVALFAPHPLLGGNMDNNVVRHLARRAAEDGAVTLRFNYRGVGNSGIVLPEGMSAYAWFDRVERERDYDVFLPECVAALEFLRKASERVAPCTVLGYSLGAILTGLLAPDPATARVIAVSPPNARVSLDAYNAVFAPKLFIGADDDTFFDSVAFEQAFASFPPPKAFLPFPNSDHFFRGEEERLYQLVKPWIFEQEPPR